MQFLENNFRQDRFGKTKAFFFKKKIIRINSKLLNSFINYSKKEKKNIRLCLHRSKSDKLHNMLVLLFKKNNMSSPHKHIYKDEVYQIIKGIIKVTVYLKRKKATFLLDKKNPIIKIPKNVFHLVNSESGISIFHETRIGPFKKNDSIFYK